MKWFEKVKKYLKSDEKFDLKEYLIVLAVIAIGGVFLLSFFNFIASKKIVSSQRSLVNIVMPVRAQKDKMLIQFEKLMLIEDRIVFSEQEEDFAENAELFETEKQSFYKSYEHVLSLLEQSKIKDITVINRIDRKFRLFIRAFEKLLVVKENALILNMKIAEKNSEIEKYFIDVDAQINKLKGVVRLRESRGKRSIKKAIRKKDNKKIIDNVNNVIFGEDKKVIASVYSLREFLLQLSSSYLLIRMESKKDALANIKDIQALQIMKKIDYEIEKLSNVIDSGSREFKIFSEIKNKYNLICEGIWGNGYSIGSVINETKEGMYALKYFLSENTLESMKISKFTMKLSNEAEVLLLELMNLIDSYSSENQKRSFSAIKSFYVVSFVSIILVVLIVSFFSIYVIKLLSGAFKEITNVLVSCSEGDLVKRVGFKFRGDFGLFINSLNKFLDKISLMIVEIISSSKVVNDSSKQLSLISVDVANVVSQITLTVADLAESADDQKGIVLNASNSLEEIMNEINLISEGTQKQIDSVIETEKKSLDVISKIGNVSDGAQQQLSEIEVMTNEIETMAGELQKVNEEATFVQGTAEDTAVIAKEGDVIVTETVEGMKKIKESSLDSTEKINELGANSIKIGEILNVINDISAQTNLLALNAAIEAARAGEHGKGFAVVADEVRKLAERSVSSTKEISTLITTIQNGTQNAVGSINRSLEEVEIGVNLSQNAKQALQEIIQSVSGTVSKINGIALSAEHVAKNTNDKILLNVKSINKLVKNNTDFAQEVNISSKEIKEVIATVAEISSINNRVVQKVSGSAFNVVSLMTKVKNISEKNANSSEETSAAMQEMSASIEEVSASSESLLEMSEKLIDQVSKFKVR